MAWCGHSAETAGAFLHSAGMDVVFSWWRRGERVKSRYSSFPGNGAWDQRWRRRLPPATKRNGICGPVSLNAKVRGPWIGLASRCLRCKRSESHVRHAIDGLGVDDLGVPGYPHCEAGAGGLPWDDDHAAWQPAMERLCTQVHQAAEAAVCRQTAESVRLLDTLERKTAYEAAVADHSGRIRQFIEVRPATAGLVSLGARFGREQAWDAVVAGKPLREVLAIAVRGWYVDESPAVQRLRWLYRRMPGDTPPLDLVALAELPLVPSDVPSDDCEIEQWLETMRSLSTGLFHTPPADVRDCLARYASRHYRTMNARLDHDALTWEDLVRWMEETGRRPSRAMPPDRLLMEMGPHGMSRCLVAHGEPVKRIEALERLGRDALPAPPFATHEGDDLRVMPLRDLRALYEEGQEMEHCILSLASDIARGGHAAYSVRLGEERTSLVLVRTDEAGWDVAEHKGVANREPSEEAEERVRAWLASMQRAAARRARGAEG